MTPRTVHGVRRPVTTPNVGAAVPSFPPMSLADLLLAFVRATGGLRYGPNPEDTDCGRATLATLEEHYGVATFDRTDREDLLISHGDASRPFSPITGGLVALGPLGAVGRPPVPLVGRVHLFQGWRVLPGGKIPPRGTVKGPNGHGGFLYADPSGRVTVVNANVEGAPWVYDLADYKTFAARYPAGVELLVLP